MLRSIAFLMTVVSANAFATLPAQMPALRSGRTMPSALKMTLRQDTNKFANSALVAAVAASTFLGFPAFDASASVITQVFALFTPSISDLLRNSVV